MAAVGIAGKRNRQSELKKAGFRWALPFLFSGASAAALGEGERGRADLTRLGSFEYVQKLVYVCACDVVKWILAVAPFSWTSLTSS